MKAVILAAGKGTRMGEITVHKPKCLLEIAGKSIIEHQIDLLEREGITDIPLTLSESRQDYLFRPKSRTLL